MKLSIPDMSADELEQLKRAHAGGQRNLAWDNYKLCKKVYDFIKWWLDEQEGRDVEIDARVFNKKAATLRQEFFNVRYVTKNNPDMTARLAAAFGAEEYKRLADTLCEGMSYRVDEPRVVIGRRLIAPPALGGNSLIAAARPVIKQSRTLKSRFEEWLMGDMEHPFEVMGEQIDIETEEQLRALAAPFTDVCHVAISGSSVLARRIG